jgi:uncharacterized membrane protein YciS (DUF1049 family)
MGGFPTWLIVIVGCAAAAIVAGAFWLRHRLRRG